MTTKETEEMKGTDFALPGQIWICMACGKRSKTRYGFDSNNKNTNIDYGWDVSCMMNSQLMNEDEAGKLREQMNYKYN